ncbi:helix-turn-helix domain-containing protein [Enterococcus casseliflavus]|uniref:helix-turn-helix domain-containing protein n=1 Tax=Enterococcus casseliflavus TaxID=37734 RepID=UPI003D0DCE7A
MDDKQRNIIIAANIKSFIRKNNITQKQLAKEIGISPSTMSDYMNLRSNPSHGVIQKIADYFGIMKSDIDTTYKESKSSIDSIYSQLNMDRQKRVYDFAKNELKEQKKEIFTIAAHSDDPNRKLSKKEFDDLNRYLDEADKKFDDK